MTTLLETRLQDGACLPGNSNVKIRIPNSQNYTYPDTDDLYRGLTLANLHAP